MEGEAGTWWHSQLEHSGALEAPDSVLCVSSTGTADLVQLSGSSDPSFPTFLPSSPRILTEKPPVFYSSNKKTERNQTVRDFVQAFFYFIF